MQDLKTKRPAQNYKGWMAVGLFLLIGIAAAVWFGQRRKMNAAQTTIQPVKKQLPVGELLAPVTLLIHGDEAAFYSFLRESVWRSFGHYFDLTGSEMSRETLFAAMRKKGFDESAISGTDRLLQKCEEGMFTKADLSADKNKLIQQTREILELIEKKFYSEYL